MILLALVLAGHLGPISTPYARTEDLSISGITATVGSPTDLRIDAHATFDNPFDPRDVQLDGTVTTPKGVTYHIPGFFSRDFTRAGDVLHATSSDGWHLRVGPSEAGSYSVTVTLRDRTGSVTSAPFAFSVASVPESGFVRVSERDRRFFESSDGKSFYPIGANLAWATKGLSDYDSWLPKMGSQGANWARVFLGPAWVTCGLEVPGKPTDGKGLEQFNLENAYRLDQVFETARDHGVSLQLVLDSYNELRDRDAQPYWDKTPHNADNGGPLRIWSAFWTNTAMDRIYRAKLRYLVARYAAYSNLFAWELWNEVDLCRDFDESTVRAWHDRMGSALKDLDPYGHLVTTSFASARGAKTIDLLPQIDFVQTHHFGDDPVSEVVTQQTRKTAWGKPHIVAEVGADATSPRASEDKLGVQIHDPQWASITTGASGTAMPWWWDSLIERNDLYSEFGAVSRFVKDVDWPGEGFRQAWPVLSYVKPPRPPERRDLTISGPISWDREGANRPKTVRFQRGKLSGELPIAGIQHGILAHRELHNPVRFILDLTRPTRFEVEVGDVSGSGGANMRIFLDGSRILSRNFADKDGMDKTDTLTQYRGAYGFTVPSGYHTVIVQNDGADWFLASYRLVKAVTSSEPPVSGYAVIGDTTCLVWLSVADRTWRNVVQYKRTIPSAPETVMRLPGLSSGTWRVQFWDTQGGHSTREVNVRVGLNGVLRVVVPAIRQDVALKILKA